mgnify:CR=1 FL=1
MGVGKTAPIFKGVNMNYETIIGGLVIGYPLLTYIAKKTPWDIDDKIVSVLDKVLMFWKKK